MTYDGLGNKDTFTAKSSTSATNGAAGTYTYTYDKKGNVLTEAAPVKSGVPDVITRYAYDSRGNVITKTEAEGLSEERVTNYKYDKLDRQIEQTGQAMTVYSVDGGERVDRIPLEARFYDKRGNLIEVLAPDFGRTLTYWDALNRKVADISPTGTLSTYSYDKAGNLVSQKVYGDVLAELPAVAGSTLPLPVNASNVRETTFTYDANNRKLSTTVKNVTVGARNPTTLAYSLSDTHITTYQEYDSAGNVIKDKDANGNLTYSYYDKLGNKTLQVDAGRYVTKWDYDAGGNMIRQTRYGQALGASTTVLTSTAQSVLLAAIPQAATDKRVVEFGFDKMNRRTEERRLNVAWSTVNDDSGDLGSASGTVTTKYTFNGLGLVTQVLDAATKATDYEYDLQGRLIKTKSAAFNDAGGALVNTITDTEYNGLGLATREIQRGKDNAVETDDRITHFYYGKNGVRTSEKDALGNVTTFSYDRMGRVTRQQLNRNTMDSLDPEFATKNEVYNDQTTVKYDLAGRQVEQVTASKLSTEANYVQKQSQQTSYNAYNEVIGKGTNNGAQEKIEYDNAGRVWRTNSGTEKGAVKVYGYDANGNATLELTSSEDDLRSITILADGKATSLETARNRTTVATKYNLFDALNKLTDSYETNMSATGASTPYAGKDASTVQRTEPISTPQNPFDAGGIAAFKTTPAVSTSTTPIWNEYLAGGAHDLYGEGYAALPLLSPYGSGLYKLTLETWVTYSGWNGDGGWVTTTENRTTEAVGYTGSLSLRNAKISFNSGLYSYGSTAKLYQLTINGYELISQTIERGSNTYYNDGDLIPGTHSSQYIANHARLITVNGLDNDTQALKMHLWRSGATDQIINLSLLSGNGRPLNGTFGMDWSALAAGDYNYAYEGVNSNGDKVAGAHGTLRLGDAPAILSQTADARPPIISYDHFIDFKPGSNLPIDALIHRQQVYNAYGEQTQEVRFKAPAVEGQPPIKLITDFTYNALGKLTKKEEPLVSTTGENGAFTPKRPATEYHYDQVGRLVGTTDANGNVTTYSLLPGSLADQPIIVKEFHADRRRVETAVNSGIFIAKEGVKRNYYDVFGQLTRTANEMWNGEGALTDSVIATKRVTSYTYDAKGQLTAVNRPGEADENYEYDSVGQRIATKLAPDANSNRQRVRTYYDALGRVTKTTTAVATRETNYDYLWVASIEGGGGWRLTTTMGDGRKLIDDTDYFGRQRWHKDLDNRAFTYRYNNAGLLDGQTSKSTDNKPTGITATLKFSGQDISFTYYGNGYLKSTIDNTRQTWTEYRYDDRGNRIFEGYARNFGNSSNAVWEYYQYSQATYDDANRLTRIWDPKSDINYEYDAVGNRRRVLSTYNDGAGGGLQTQDFWYTYDNMNRFIITMGSLNTVTGKVDRGTGESGRIIDYNYLSQRTGAVGMLGTEKYTYDDEGYLEEVLLNGARISIRDNDARGNVRSLEETSQSIVTRHAFAYDADNLLTSDTESVGETVKSTTIQTLEASTGLLMSSTRTPSGGGVATKSDYVYEYWDSAKQSDISIKVVNDPKWQAGSAKITYDENGHALRFHDRADNKWYYYSTDADGRITRREEIDGPDAGPRQNNRIAAETTFQFENYYFFNGKQVGDVAYNTTGAAPRDYAQILAQRPEDATQRKAVSSADFDQNFQPIGPNYPGRTGSVYTVGADGESLQGIAQAVWGDASLWYLIADANGLTSSSQLKAGQTLLIPNKVTNVHNNTQTSRPYDPAQALGDISPTLPDPPPPPKKKGCGGLGMIIMVVVAVVASVVTAGAALAAIASMGGPAFATVGAALASGTMAGVATGIGAAAVGAAVGSIASQLVGMATGDVQKFSWSAVGRSALTAAVTAGAGVAANATGLFAVDALGKAASFPGMVGQAVVTNVISQGVGTAIGLQKKFSWTGVASAGLSAAANAGANSLVGSSFSGLGAFGESVARGTIGGIVSGWVDAKVRHEKPNWNAIAANSFGSALGDAVVGSIVGGDQKKAPQKQEPEYQSKPLTQADIDGFLSGLDDIPGANDGKDWSGFSKDRQARAAASRLGGAPNSLNELGGGLSGIDIPASSTPGQVAQKGDSWAKLARQQYGDERYALVLAQANGANSTLLRAGDSVYFPDLSGADLKQGGQLIAADTQARAQRQAAAAQQATNANQLAEPVWSFKEASMAQRKLDDAAAAVVGRKIYETGLANAPSASQWNGKSNDPYAQTRMALEKAFVMPVLAAATAPVSLEYFAVGAAAGGAVNLSFQMATKPSPDWVDVGAAAVTGGLTFGKGVLPSVAINTAGALVTSTMKGEDPTWKMAAAATGTVLGGPVGNSAASFMKNVAIAKAISSESSSLSMRYAQSVLPSNGVASSIVSETTGLGFDFMALRYGEGK
ncbi:MAG: LysM peptidoglycan-binding domain-containing protein [Aquabacterium sp.]|uniref:LysM peptidoglycan-binding domain-containing protein n=1 Tax=Aquabacterium sp. TaxID=1872578 RepID=UPI002725DFCA|nr:LysM peptidoglycan-binding domain-containing protein [Aquabacterium sp.]MDO9005753.1 LysM peptidoglycan-binding domain-containing protein [Aquabacterium sp.]